MARRGNQQRNGLDRRTSKHTKRLAETGCANPDSKGQGKSSDLKVSPGEELPNGNHRTPSDLSINDMGTMSHNLDGNKSQQTSGSFQRKENEVQELEEPVFSGNSASDCSTSFVEPPGAGEEKESLTDNGSGPKHIRGLDYLLNHLHFTSILMVRNVRALCLTFLKTAGEWLEGQRPSVIALMNKLYNARDYVKLKIGQAYPVFLKWLVHIGNLLLLLSMVWLDCSLRGIGSFLRMGTTSCFSVIWFSIFSVIAMVGMSKFLIVLAIAAFVGVFIGLILGLLIVAIAGIVFLWLNGSFWTTMLVILVGGLAFILSHERLMLLITTVYSIYCAWGYVGWLGVLVALNISFISSDILVYFLKSTIHQHQGFSGPSEQSVGVEGQPGSFNSESFHASSSETGPTLSSDRGPGMPSTSGTESELASEDEVMRLLNCSDHYQALGLSRYENVDASFLKREYRKKAMLVHPDKNMGNEKAAEAFKKLQNAYEVLLDSLKRKAYDDELRTEELLNYFRRFQSTSQKNGAHGFSASGFTHSEGDGEDPFGDSRQIACERCSNFHVWVHTKKPKSRARWCQDCNDFHQAKDGDGWVEQFSQPFLFGILRKVDAPSAYVCADSKIYNVTEWYICQEMRCPTNTHKPSFHVNTSVTSKHNGAGKRSKSGQRSSRMPASNEEETMSGEEFFEWFQNAVQSGMYQTFSTSADSPSATAGGGNGSKSGGTGSGSGSSSSSKRKKKGKKQW